MNRNKWSVGELVRRHTMEQLVALMQELQSDPANANPLKGSIYLYTKETNRKLDNIGFAITTLMGKGKNGTN